VAWLFLLLGAGDMDTALWNEGDVHRLGAGEALRAEGDGDGHRLVGEAGRDALVVCSRGCNALLIPDTGDGDRRRLTGTGDWLLLELAITVLVL
jgi:hypothetical protein